MTESPSFAFEASSCSVSIFLLHLYGFTTFLCSSILCLVVSHCSLLFLPIFTSASIPTPLSCCSPYLPATAIIYLLSQSHIFLSSLMSYSLIPSDFVTVTQQTVSVHPPNYCTQLLMWPSARLSFDVRNTRVHVRLHYIHSKKREALCFVMHF